MPVPGHISGRRRLPYCGCYIIVHSTPKYLPLFQLDARTRILCSTWRTTLTQTFVNPSEDSTLSQARYAFPLYDGVSVVGFTCTVGSRVIKGVVQERQAAKETYKRAASSGEAASLLEQSRGESDVFTTTLGNIPAGEQVQVEITYLGELKHDAEIDGLRFTIPTSIAPRYGGQSLAAEHIRPDSAISITVDVDVSDGSSISSIQSPSHPISVSIGTTSAAMSAAPSPHRARAALSQGSAELDKDVIIQIVAAGLGDPAAVLETHPILPNQRALMTTLVPRFNLPVEKPEVVFVCDRSGSMGNGRRIPNLIAALQIFLKSLPVGVKFNICSFGSSFSFLWKQSQAYNQETLEEAISHVKGFSADFGGTAMYQPMKQTFEQRYKDMDLEVFLLTDGQIREQNELFKLINSEVTGSKGAIRVFTLGVGKDASHALIEGVARAGNGFAQTVADDEKMDKKLVRMLKGALTTHVNDYTLEIKYNNDDGPVASDNDDDFELVEKVMDSLTIDVGDDSGHTSPPPQPWKEKETSDRPIISLFDPSLKNEDLEMPKASTLPEVKLPPVTPPRYLQAPFKIPPLFAFNRTTVHVLLSESTPARQPKSVVLKGTSRHGPLALDIPVSTLAEKGTTIHQLAARKAISELEEGRGWITDAKDNNGKFLKEEFEGRFSDMIKREAVRLGVEHQVAGKWCSFVAVLKDDNADGRPDKGDDGPGEEVGVFEVVPANDTPQHRGARSNTIRGMAMAAPAMAQMRMHAPPTPAASMKAASYSAQPSAAYCPPSLPIGGGGEGVQRRMPSFGSGEAGKRKGRMASAGPKASAIPGGANSTSVEATEPLSPLSALATLQTFAGSWEWSGSLERVVGVTKQQALSEVSLPAQYDQHEDVLATICAMVYLKTKLAGEKETWELLANKAEDWLARQTGAPAESLEKIVVDSLSI